VRSTVPISTQITLKIGAAEANVTVEANGGDLIENDSTFHTDVDQGIIDRLPPRGVLLRSRSRNPLQIDEMLGCRLGNKRG